MTGSAAPGLRLGLDLGTCFLKAVLWVPGEAGARAIVLRPSGPGLDYRMSTRVVLLDRALWFGAAAEARARIAGAVSWTSLKARVLTPEIFDGPAPPAPEGISLVELLALVAAEPIRRARAAAEALGLGHLPLTVALGTPRAPEEAPEEAAALAAVGRLALAVAALPWDGEEGRSVAQVRALLDAASPSQDVALVPELDASLAWFHESPWVKPGRFALVDVGARFSRAACIELDPGPAPRTKGQTRCWGVRHLDRGADTIDLALARAAGELDPTAMRGNEGTLIVRHRPVVGAAVGAVVDEVFQLYRDAHALAWQGAPGAWGDYGLLLIGGGSWIRVIREHMLGAVRPELAMGPSLLNAGKPDGLHEVDGRPFAGDPDFLMVAWGLARGGLPEEG